MAGVGATTGLLALSACSSLSTSSPCSPKTSPTCLPHS
ncbi:MAG: hypothetical protein ACFNXE_08885 [Rothia dentocariosa]